MLILKSYRRLFVRVLYTVECAVHSIRTAPSRICKVCDMIMIGSKMSHALVAEIASITWDYRLKGGGGAKDVF